MSDKTKTFYGMRLSNLLRAAADYLRERKQREKQIPTRTSGVDVYFNNLTKKWQVDVDSEELRSL